MAAAARCSGVSHGLLLPRTGCGISALSVVPPVLQQRHPVYHSVIPHGRSGRSSVSGIVATVFGATGFLGRHVVSRLGRIGSQIIIPYGCDQYDLVYLRQMAFFRVQRALKTCESRLRTVGEEFEQNVCYPESNGKDGGVFTRNFSFEDEFVNIPKSIAQITGEAGVETFIHISHLNTSTKSPSKYLRSKAVGEIAVREEFPDALIMKPSEVSGREDRFLNHYASTYS
ncbi:hypothetical protein ASZ78_003588 [Callipepla squamata]|uniref:NADH dehydrogenase [ubiquinone] 1 alpha subcomplex subunit 9, mitochondrial n=1 Tax=Callipepla squamata TaxID=9009 RepID=A0A226MC04_CALSU|nr:hypothetical protein ASZ78_003588 [Callipepla squamata]